ncbi:MAG: beta-aspartyl-peptidase [Spirochaetales bacterium]|nr:beta-aspartyl-peptidase [Spirochaetales bacterium]
MSSLTLLKNAYVYAPKDLGIKDILFGGSQILALEDKIDLSFQGLKVIDLAGSVVLPGLIDGHVHVIGGGGEDGLSSKVPPIKEVNITNAGVTTLVGVLGTDGYTRTVEELVSKTKAINEYGLSAYCLTGSYQVPTVTLTGDVGKDIIFINEVLGVKIAISDHRCSLPTVAELTRLATICRMAGLIGKKCGILHLHVGRAQSGIEDLFKIVKDTPLPITTFYPTHMSGHLEQSKEWLKLGGHIDLTCHTDTVEAVNALMGINDTELTLSTDSNGSFPKWNDKNEIIGMGAGSISTLYKTLKELIDQGFPPSFVYSLATSNPAKALKLTSKGQLKPGFDADLVVLKEGQIDKVFAKGVLLKDRDYVKKGMYDDIV